MEQPLLIVVSLCWGKHYTGDRAYWFVHFYTNRHFYASTRRCNVLKLSVRPCDGALPNLWTQYFEDGWTDFDVNWPMWSTGQGH